MAKTSARVAKEASQVLRQKSASAKEKSVAGAALRERRSK